jgi:chromosome segregation ATPase
MMRHDRNEPTNERLAAYAEAMRDPGAVVDRRVVTGVYPGLDRPARETLSEWQVRAVMAVADAEQAELRAEVERLRGWYADARAVLGNMDRLITEANSRSDLAQAEVAHWKNHAGEAGRGFTQVCQDAARTAARNTELARLREADVLRAEAAEAEVERLRKACIPLTDLAQELDLARQNLHHARAMGDAHFARAEAAKGLAEQWRDKMTDAEDRAEKAEAEVERLRAEIRDRESERADLRDRVQKAEAQVARVEALRAALPESGWVGPWVHALNMRDELDAILSSQPSPHGIRHE